MSNMIEKIQAAIAAHQAEIDKLETALAVCLKLEKAPAPKEKPLFTVRRREGPKPKPRKGGGGQMTVARQKIHALLTERGELTSGEMAQLSGCEQKVIYNAVYHMRQMGQIERNEAGRFVLLPEDEPADAAPVEPKPVASDVAA